jgi:proteasome lid subunit RPN8/RPN11
VTLLVDTAVRSGLLSHARAAEPEEACGVLGGRREDDTLVTEARPVENVASDPRGRYELAPADQRRAPAALAAAERAVVGLSHPHPRGPATPSDVDRALATWPDHTYLIVSLPDPTIRAWWWTGDRFLERRVQSAPIAQSNE